MVEYICTGLEWLQHPQAFCWVQTDASGKWDCAAVLAPRMAEYWDHYEGPCASHSYLHWLGVTHHNY